ncbi:hypothetical protein ACFSVK_14855 [Azorhizophilus paspali]|uniref:hypothetical protein n=1 Tax=Azorhizophilus paspali TaxID=69963 RepID=UPI00362C5DAE
MVERRADSQTLTTASPPGAFSAVGGMLMGGLARPPAGEKAYAGQQSAEDETPGRADNLFAPVEGLYRATGRFADQAQDKALGLASPTGRSVHCSPPPWRS